MKRIITVILTLTLVLGMGTLSTFAADTDNSITIAGATMTPAELKTAVNDALANGKRDFTITGNLSDAQQKEVGWAFREWCGINANGDLYNTEGQGTVTLTLPDVTEVFADTFGEYDHINSYALKQVNLPKATVIGDSAFSQSKYIQGVTAPNVTAIGNYTFWACESLASIDLPKVETVGTGSFAFTAITTFPWENLISIESTAFRNCGGITGNIYLPKISFINQYTFMNSGNIGGIYVPNTTAVEDSAFARNYGLTRLSFKTPMDFWGNQVLHEVDTTKITLSLAADQKVLSGGDNSNVNASPWTIADGAPTVEFGLNKSFCGYTFREIKVIEDDPFSGIPSKVYMDYNPGIDGGTIYSVDISWGAMEFTYNEGGPGVWNRLTHTYDGATKQGWSVDTDGGDLVTLTNHSNAGVKAEFAYSSQTGYESITGTLSGEGITAGKATLPTAENTAPESAPAVTAKLTLSGSVPANMPTIQTVIGTLTVRIESAT